MLAVPQEMRLTFTIANNICTLLMPVYKYGIAMFYIYISIYVYIYIYSHTLERDKEKDLVFPGKWFDWRAPELSTEEGIHDNIST